MRNARFLLSGLLPAIVATLGFSSLTQAAGIDDCRTIQDRLARYACYDSWDAAAGTVSRASRPQERVVQSEAEANGETAEEDETSLFGRVFNRDSEEAQPKESGNERSLIGRIFNRDSEEAQPEEPAQAAEPESAAESFGRVERSSARVQEGEDGRNELIATIAALERRGPNTWLITLEGGQRWVQMYSKSYFLEVGDEVRIYPTRWGRAYRLTAERLAGYIQVERVD